MENSNIVPKRSKLIWAPFWIGLMFGFTIIGLIYAIWFWIIKRSEIQMLTNSAIVVSEGVIFKEKKEVRYDEVVHIGFKQHKLEKFLGYGNLFVIGKAGKAVVLRFLREPEIVKRQIEANLV